MSRVVIKSGFRMPDGAEDELAEFTCDWPDCPNLATQVLGCVKELGLATAVCDEHSMPPRSVKSPPKTLPPRVGVVRYGQ